MKKGTFEIFSRPGHSTEPLLQWQNDFFFSAESVDNCFLFKRIEVAGIVE